jgi:hypothetical protein
MSFFYEDLDYGEQAEREILKYLAKPDDVIKHMAGGGKFSDYDYVINGVTFEQKTDKWTYKTNNLCIEMRNKRGEDTGLLTTKAKQWVHYPINTNKLIIIPVSKLKEICGNYLYRIGESKALRVLKGNECMLLPEGEIPIKYIHRYSQACLL